jgi:hypothetical protein
MRVKDEQKKRVSGKAHRCAVRLKALGWSREDIRKILAGPRQSSIHEIAGDPVEVWSVPTVEAVSVPESDNDQKVLVSRTAFASSLGIGQKEIADAVWASVSAGDPLALAAIARQLAKLSPPLQAYLLACSTEVKRFYQDLTAWKRDFDRAQKEADSQRKKERKEGEGAAHTAVGVVTAVATAAAAANAVPIVGQVVSAALALGLAVATAILEANPLPVRKSEEQVRPGYEGVSVFRGLVAAAPETPYEDRYLALKQAVVQDEMAFALPAVTNKTRFDFAPRLAAFQEAAHQMGLYPEDGIRT